MNNTENFHIYNAVIETNAEIHWLIKQQTQNQTIMFCILLGSIIVMGVVIIINQIRLRKQLRQIQEQLSRAEAGGEDTADK